MRDILDRPGNDLLSRVLRHSTISAEEFNGRVRDGIGFWLLAQATGPAKDMASIWSFLACILVARQSPVGMDAVMFAVFECLRTLIMRTIKPIEQLVPVS
jgi:hypothetical protein